MNILIINPILYTSETKIVTRTNSIKDCMIYDFCLAFQQLGHHVTLYAGEPFKPKENEIYSFEILWGKCVLQKICMPHCLPFIPEVFKYIRKHLNQIDLIISSEIFSMNSLMAYWVAPRKLIIWHELAKHNAIFNRIPSKIWYKVLVPIFMHNVHVIARSKEAKSFISKYCHNTEKDIIGHGVNLDKFQPCIRKENTFVVCSQLIERKKIDGILNKFAEFLKSMNTDYLLYIIGDGELKTILQNKAEQLGISQYVIFTGKLNHTTLLPYISHAKAVLINTIKDNSMISIVESIAVGTPVITTKIPLNSSTINKYHLGIADSCWDETTLYEIVSNNEFYVSKCMEYRETLSTKAKANRFLTFCTIIE